MIMTSTFYYFYKKKMYFKYHRYLPNTYLAKNN